MTDSLWKLSCDPWSASAIVWVASVGRDASLTREAHLYSFDRYQRLANYYRLRGKAAKSTRLQQKADEHLHEAGGDGPPYAAAMAMPRPKPSICIDAISRTLLKDPGDAA
jgi:hypothetical protein